MCDINNKEGSYFNNTSMNQSTIISASQRTTRSHSKRFQRTTQRSQSSRSFKSSKSKQKDVFYPKLNIKIGTYIKKQQQLNQTTDNYDLISQRSEGGVCKFNGILSAKSRDQFNIISRDKLSNSFHDTPNKQYSTRHKQKDQQFYSQRKELNMLQQILQKQRRMRQQAILQNKKILKKLTQIQLQNNILKQENQQKQKQLRRLKILVSHLEAQNQQNAELWKTIDILQMDKIQKEQEVRQLLLYRQTDQKTILRLTEQIAHYRKHKNHKLPPFPKAEIYQIQQSSMNNSSFMQNKSSIFQSQLDQKQGQISKLTEEIKLLSIKYQKQNKKILQDKKRVSQQYQRKLAAISSSYRIAQRQLNILRKSNNDGNSQINNRRRIGSQQDFEYSLSPSGSLQNKDPIK